MSDAPTIIIPGREVRHECFCGAQFYDTGDPRSDDLRFLRHERKCSEAHELADKAVDRRENEPLSQYDKEQVDFLRAEAERKGDFSVKGTSGWPAWMAAQIRKAKR